MQTKNSLRSELRATRDRMTLAQVVEKSEAILTGVLTILNNLKFSSLHCYEPMINLHEVDISPLFDLPDAALYTSRKLGDTWSVVSVIDNSATSTPRLDVIIVPMLGFDSKLHRVGYGGGYYDRLLAAHPHALKIGVCFEQGRVEHVPTQEYDVPLNVIITEASACIAV
jgi:5,10-methenyltetrahydrofolate synthetase